MSADGPDGPFLIGIDVGTQSVRALLADRRGRTLGVASRPTPTHRLGDAGAEYEPDHLWQAVLSVLGELARRVPPGGEVAGMAAASMGEACFLLDADGDALAPAIAWFDRRTEAVGARLAREIGAETLFAITGQHPDSTCTLCKLLWQREATPALFAQARRALNVADWVAWRLCGEAATDPSLASRTLCLDIHARDWSRALLDRVGIDPALLPPIRPSGTTLGRVRPGILAATGLPGRPVVAVGGHDHVVGGFAAGSARPGCLLDSMGTAEALFLTLASPPSGPDARAGGFAQGIMMAERPLAYVGAGLNCSGGAVEWLRGLLGEAPSRAALQAEAEAEPPGSGGVCFLPHLAYGGPPHRDIAARGAFIGLTTAAGRGALLRAVLEGLAMEARLVADSMAALPGIGPPDEIRVIGGSIQNDLFLRIKASVQNRALSVVAQPEATGLGAALLGGIGAGLWPDLAAAHAAIHAATGRDCHTVAPVPEWVARYDALYERVHRGLYSALRPVNHTLSRLYATHGA